MKTAILQKNALYGKRIEDLFAQLDKHSDELLNRTPDGGGWSAIQTMHHLLLTEEKSMAYIRKKLSFNPKLSRIGPGAHWRSFLLWAYLNTPIKFKAPAAVGDENLPQQATLAETKNRWQAIRQEWNTFFEQMPADLVDKAVYKHPRAGKLGFLQLLGFFMTHLKRHRRQIFRALR